jgi:hypothetical protein
MAAAVAVAPPAEHAAAVAALRKAATICYDPTTYDFRGAVLAGLGLPSTGEEAADAATLGSLTGEDDAAEMSPAGTDGGGSVRRRSQRRGANRGPSTQWIQRWKRSATIECMAPYLLT